MISEDTVTPAAQAEGNFDTDPKAAATQFMEPQPTSDSSSASTRPSDRIRIGSARGVEGPITAKPHVKPVPPLEQPKSQTTNTEASEAALAETEESHEQAEDTIPDAPAMVGPPAPAIDGPPKKYPPPNLRAKLTPDEEMEMEAMLAGASLDDLMESSTAALAGAQFSTGSRLTGKVSKVFQEDIFLELPGKQQGLLSARQFPPGELPEVGTEVDVLVISDGEDGLYELSLPTAAVAVGNWDDVQAGGIVEVLVSGVNKGGLECEVAGIRGFMPMGQISVYRVENPEEMIGQRIAAVVTEANRGQRNLVLSHRGVMERERAENREKLLAELAPGQFRDGTVRSVRDFGAFVDLGGVDGLIHVSKLSWDRVNHPSEVVSEGQAVKVKVERVDADTGKISLSLRETADNPWDSVESKYGIGDKLTGTVSKTMDFGAFVKLEPGVEGLIHISELAHGRVMRTTDVVKEGQEVEVKILSVDRDKQRIGLSLRALLEPPQKVEKADDAAPMPEPPGAPKAPPKRTEQLKGGTSVPSGGDKFGLKW